jgi:hypothetical protein
VKVVATKEEAEEECLELNRRMVEATVLGSYNIPWRYEEVATVSVLTVDGRERRFRLKMDGLKAFTRTVREALGEGAPESMREE